MDYNVTYRPKNKGLQVIISYKDVNGKWKQKSKQGFEDSRNGKKEAKIAADDMLQELKEELKFNISLDPELKGLTFKSLMEMYVGHKELHREYGTIRLINSANKKFVSLDDMALTDITNVHTQNCVDEMVRQGLSFNTIYVYNALIKTAFNYAIDKGIIKDNPLDKIVTPDDKSSDEINPLNKWELEDLFTKIKNVNYLMISMIAGTCGLRIGEISGLTWDSVDLKNATITVNKQWKRLGKNEWGFGKVKKKNSNRVVPIPNSTLLALKKYDKEIAKHISGRIFYKNKSIANLSESLTGAYKKAGYTITVHDLRHTYATLLIGNGVDFKTAAKLLGHDVEMTMKTYSHVSDEMMTRATNTLNLLFK